MGRVPGTDERVPRAVISVALERCYAGRLSLGSVCFRHRDGDLVRFPMPNSGFLASDSVGSGGVPLPERLVEIIRLFGQRLRRWNFLSGWNWNGISFFAAAKLQNATEPTLQTPSNNQEEPLEGPDESSPAVDISERRKALFEPLEPATNVNGRRGAEFLLPPPDFDIASYPKGWLIGKKRKLVNVDVVESMRRIAVQEMNRKDREIDGLNEQLDEDARALEHLQLQLLQERSKRADVEREKNMLQNQVSMLMDMLQEPEEEIEEGTENLD
ncbi:hypothetical protein GIB67_035744 [Kingdonia uniflora]|uniref:Protein HEADING DATE REPRESSOR 1 n=1 Tax=Kingdonia uniflora TaxID=39325 RepID=A0A7J7MJF6_9MAGN|nr:hypothetical protein GIB67_035744 [Kingdonia uniflora]